MRLAVLPLLLLLLAASAGAQGVFVLYDTYPDDNTHRNLARIIGLPPFPGTPPGRSDQYADPFGVPVGEGDFLLDAVILKLRCPLTLAGTACDPTVLGNQVVRLFADGGDEPGAVLESWTVPPSGSINTFDVRLEPSQDLLLLEGATYWVGVAMSQRFTSARWMLSEGATSAAWRWAQNQYAEQPNGWLLPLSMQPVGLMRVEAVPEASGTLAALGSAGLLASLRARRRRPCLLPRPGQRAVPRAPTP